MKRNAKILYHKDLLAVIDTFSTPMVGILSKKGSPLSGIEASLSHKQKGFKVEFEYDRSTKTSKRIDLGVTFKKLLFRGKGINIIFEKLWIGRHAPPTFEGDVDFFHTEGYSKKRAFYHRLVFPLKQKLDFRYQIVQLRYQSDLGTWPVGTKAYIEKDEFIAYTFEEKKGKKQYFVIESDKKSRYDDFSEKAFALKNAIGYLTGYLIGDAGYFFAYSRKSMKDFEHYYFCSFRDTIKSSYSPLYTNPYSILHHKPKVAEKYYNSKELLNIPSNVLSSLANKLYSSLEFSSAIMLILESSVASLLFMPGGFAIVLETLSDLIMGDEKPKLAPIKDKLVAKKLRKSLIEVIDEQCTDVESQDLKVLKIRVDNINQITNGARLKAPFSKLGISLLPKDMEILEARNAFLHGRIPDISKSGLISDTERKNKDLYYASMRFYTLLNMLILKWAGFDGHVINYPKVYSDYTKIKLKEPFYRKIE